MAIEIKRVFYAYNGALEADGQLPYYLDAYVSHDGRTLVDIHKAYGTREELFAAMESVVPLLEEGDDDGPTADGGDPNND